MFRGGCCSGDLGGGWWMFVLDVEPESQSTRLNATDTLLAFAAMGVIDSVSTCAAGGAMIIVSSQTVDGCLQS